MDRFEYIFLWNKNDGNAYLRMGSPPPGVPPVHRAKIAVRKKTKGKEYQIIKYPEEQIFGAQITFFGELYLAMTHKTVRF